MLAKLNLLSMRNTFLFTTIKKAATVRSFVPSNSSKNMKETKANDDILHNKSIFPDFANGPLTKYRKQATFCYKRMSLILEDEEHIRFKNKIWDFMEKHPEFQHDKSIPNLDKARQMAWRRANLIRVQNFFSLEDYLTKPRLAAALSQALFSYECSSAIKHMLSNGMFTSTLLSMGGPRFSEYIERVVSGEITGSYALTEFSHGTNARGVRTRATYDAKTKEIILHTPDFEAAKTWVGNLGKTCTHSIVYAQLYVPDNEYRGLSAFLVPIRDECTLNTFPGVMTGDLGDKIGLRGVDNGFVMFNNYRIPRENLLAKHAKIDENGNYVSNVKGKGANLGLSLGALSSGRVNICSMAYFHLAKAITIATRYSASREQFGPEASDKEWPVLEYQSQQYRLFPHLATAYALRVFTSWIYNTNMEFTMRNLMGESVAELGMEIHALSSAAKPVCSWAVRDAIQECREACGGHGYLHAAGLGTLRNENDANCTYEGENNTLIQQTSNWLINLKLNGGSFAKSSPLETVTFLENMYEILQTKAEERTVEDAMRPNNILKALNWLCAWQLDITANRSKTLKAQQLNTFEIRNNLQVFHARDLSIIYGERTIYYIFYKFVQELAATPEHRVLEQLLSFYGAHLISKHFDRFYRGGYFQSQHQGELYEKGILNMLPELKREAIALIDAIAPRDFIINSPLGMSDGKVYEHLQKYIETIPEAFERPSWWGEVVNPTVKQKSKM